MGGQRSIDHLYEDVPHVSPDPLLKNLDEKLSQLFRAHRPVSHLVARLEIEWARVAGPLSPAQIGDRHKIGVYALNNRDKLDELCLKNVAKVPVNLQWMLHICRMDCTKNVELDSVLLEQFPALHHLVERPLAAFVDAVGVVQFFRPIHTQPDKKAVFLEERAPFIVEARSVGLNGVIDLLARLPVFVDQFHRTTEEIQSHQRRFAALPGNEYCLRPLRL